MEWISVEERLPEDEGPVIGFIPKVVQSMLHDYKGCVCELRYFDRTDGGGQRFFKLNESFIDLSDVSHWMPLPEPPKEDPRKEIRHIAQRLRKEGLSYQKIAGRLNNMGHRNAIGNLFTHGSAWTLLGSGAAPEEVKP